MRAPDDERAARVDLSTLGEPGDARLWAAVRDHGPVAALERVRAGAEGERYRGRIDLLGAADALERAVRLGARYVVPGDLEWPSQLDDLDLPAGDGQRRAVPPLGLWVVGPHHLRMACLRSAAVVGSRAATAYGCQTAAEIGAGLADRGWSSVSGAAYGIDSAAHRGSLAAGGVTVAVLACGVDLAYPRGHQGLLERIGAEGLVTAELPLGAHPTRGRFLDRNRLIAALTPGTVLVEAAYRSGAANTTMWARRTGRRVLGVPGPVGSTLSAGVHREIRERGATLVTGAGDVVTELGDLGDAFAEADTRARSASQDGRAHDGLSPLALRVLDALDPGHCADLHALAARAALTPEEVAAELGGLSARGLAEDREGRWRARLPAERSAERVAPHRGGP